MEVKADEIEGYRGDNQISEILQYIETPKDKKKGRNSTEKKNQENARRPPKKGRRESRKDEDDEPEAKTHHKTSSIGGVDDIDKLVYPTLKRSSSFGEMPCDMSPFEGTSMRTGYNEDPDDISLEEEPKKANLEEMDFTVVTRSKTKRKSKEKKVAHKEGSERGYKNFLEYECSKAMLFMNLTLNHRQNDKIKSASSAPPSDHSDCSDHDSVCSLPAGSTTPKPSVDKKSTSMDCTPHSSYAEITKMKPVKYPISPPEKMSEYMHAGTQTASACKEQEVSRVTPNGPVGATPFEMMPSQTSVIKKDAMTCTSQDYSLLPKQVSSTPPSGDALPSDKQSEPVVKETVLEVNVLADYYPSLEEAKMTWKEKGLSAIESNGTSGEMKASSSSTNCRTASRSEASPSASSGCSANQNKCRTSEAKASLPPVIMVPYEGMEGVGGVTFGFEPNEQLLALDPKSLVDQPPNAQQIDVVSRYRPLPEDKPTYNYEVIVNFIEKSWDIVKQQLHKSNPNPENTQYYCV